MEIRKILGLETEDQFIAYGKDDYVVFKKVDLPSLKKEYEELVQATSKITEDARITDDAIDDEIRKYRKEKEGSSK
ncbi:MAG: hypothetical protein U9R75_05665 [Candidatus Thermoplasmatota archaeon]|nr:hypothetical protein [Candidatus Thermoplasmatota archaeon]